MKVGEYVRFKTLSREIKIGRVIEIIEPDKESMKKYCVYDLDNNEVTVDDYIIKSSPNIIDLIKRFDFVNGHLVICKMYEDEKDIPTIIKCVGDYYFKEEDIKSIVTSEQFSQMEYRIGE